MNNPLDPNTWANARAYAGLLGEIPSSFSAVTRVLASDSAPDCSSLQPSGRFLAQRLIRTSTIKTALSFAAVTFKPEKYPNVGGVRDLDLLADYTPLDLGAMLGLIYIYRKARALSPADEWVHIDANLSRHLDVGIHVGYALPNAGVAAGIFVGGYIPLAQAMYLRHDPKGFKEYRRHLRANGLPYDQSYECERWDCTSVQIASSFIQALGLGVPLAEAFAVGISSEDSDGNGLSEGAYRFFILERWSEAILRTGDIPDITHRGQYYPMKPDLDRLRALTESAGSLGSRYRWLEKTKSDIPDEIESTIESAPPGAISEDV